MQLRKRRRGTVDTTTVKILVHLVVTIMPTGDRMHRKTVVDVPVNTQADLVDVINRRFTLVGQVDKRSIAVETRILWQRLAAILDVVIGEDGVDRIGRRPAQGCGQTAVVHITGAAAQVFIVVIAVTIPLDPADLECQLVVDQRYVHTTLEDRRVVIANFGVDLVTPLVELGPGTVDDDVAANGVATKEHTLRSPVHFDALDVKSINQLTRGGPHLDPVHNHPDLRALGFFDFCITHAADEDRAGARTGSVHADIEVGCHTVKVAQRFRLQALDCLFAEGGDGQWHVLLGLLTASGRHHDLLDHTRYPVPRLLQPVLPEPVPTQPGRPPHLPGNSEFAYFLSNVVCRPRPL